MPFFPNKNFSLPIFNSYNRIKIVLIYAHVSSKPTSLIKRRIEYLTKALLARFVTINVSKFSRRFENDYIHEIECCWSVNINKTGPILAVYCVWLSHATTCHFSIFSNFIHFCANFQIFCPFYEKSQPCSQFLE